MLKYRLITAAVLFPVCVAAIFFLPSGWFALCMAAVVLFASWEWSAFVRIKTSGYRVLYAITVGALLGLTFWVPIIYWFILASVLWLWAFAAVITYSKGHHACGFENGVVTACVGAVMLTALWLAANVLRNTMMGPFLLLFGLLLVWSVDTGAYFVGRRFGKHLLSPRVSPAKTWEGLIGGVLFCVLFSVVYAATQHVGWQSLCIIGVLALVTAAFAVIGDLFESMLKRQVDIKDSGALFPGHGGLLDRLDSIMAALPIFALGLVFIR